MAEPGELVALSGTSGSGKSTLLSILGLILEPQSVSYHAFDTNPYNCDTSTQAKLRNLHIGMIFQHPCFLSHLSILENTCLPFTYSTRKPNHQRAHQLLKDLNIRETHRSIHELSQGQQQRVSVARALLLQPSLILADEPTSALDDENTLKVMQLLQQEVKLGSIAIISTHDPNVIEQCNRHISIENTEIIEHETLSSS